MTAQPVGSPTARTTRALTLRALASTVHAIPEDRVGAGELEVTRGALPPGTVNDPTATIPSGTPIHLGVTPIGVGLERDQLDRVRALTSTPETQRALGVRDPVALQQAITARQAELDRVTQALQQRARLGETDATARLLARNGQTQAIATAYERLERDVQNDPRLTAALRLSRAEVFTQAAITHRDAERPEQALDALRRADDDLTKLGDATPREHLAGVEIMRARVAEERADVLARQPLVDRAYQDPGYSELAIAPAPRSQGVLANERVGEIDAATREARERLQRLALEHPAQVAVVKAAIERLEQRTRELSADVLARGGEHQRVADIYLPPSLRDLAPVLTPDGSRRLDANGIERDIVSGVVHGSTAVGELTPSRLRAAVDRINGATPEERRKAIDALVAIGFTHARVGDTGHLNAVRQVLAEVERNGGQDAPIRRRMLEAAVHERTKSFTAADTVLRDTITATRELPVGVERQTLESAALLARAGVLRRGALESDDDAVKARSTQQLRVLREDLTRAPGPLSRTQVASLALMEADTYLRAGDPRAARTTLASLEAFGDVPWARDAAAAFRRDNTDAGLWAALKVGLRATNSGNLLVDVGVPLGAAAIGAVGGAFVGGPVGAGIGFIGGSIVGVLGTRGYNALQGWDKVLAARDTGMTHLRWHDAAFDAVALGVDVFTSAAPLRGVARIGTAGITALATRTGAGTIDALLTATTRLGPAAAAEALEAEARKVLAEQFLSATARFGGRTLAATTAAAVTVPLALQYAAIARMADGPEKRQALDDLNQTLQRTALLATGNILTAGATFRIANALGRRVSPAAFVPTEALSSEALLAANPNYLRRDLPLRTPDGFEALIDQAGTQFTWMRGGVHGPQQLYPVHTANLLELNHDRLFGAPPPPTALEISNRYRDEHHIPPGVRIPDQYRDDKFAGSEHLIIDRRNDPELRADLAFARGLRHLAPEQRIHVVLDHVRARMSRPNEDFYHPWRDWRGEAQPLEALYRGQDLALGHVCRIGAGICRHRAALFKAMADEAGLRVGMRRGFYVDADNAHFFHAWNTWITPAGELRVIEPSAPGLHGYVDPMHARTRYLGYDKQPLY